MGCQRLNLDWPLAKHFSSIFFKVNFEGVDESSFSANGEIGQRTLGSSALAQRETSVRSLKGA